MLNTTTRKVSGLFAIVMLLGIYGCDTGKSPTEPKKPQVSPITRIELLSVNDSAEVGISQTLKLSLTSANGQTAVAPANSRVVLSVSPTGAAYIGRQSDVLWTLMPTETGGLTITATFTDSSGAVQLTTVRQLISVARVPGGLTLPSTLSNDTLEVGSAFLAPAQVLDTKGRPMSGDYSIRYSSSDTTIVSVDTSGRLTPLKQGSATLTARLDSQTDSIVTSTTVRVRQIVPALYPTVIRSEPGLGGQLWAILRDANGKRVRAQTVVYRSSNPAVLTVSLTGSVKVLSPGTADIEVRMTTAKGTYSASTPVTVQPQPPVTFPVKIVYMDSTSDLKKAAIEKGARRFERIALQGKAWQPDESDYEVLESVRAAVPKPFDWNWNGFLFHVKNTPLIGAVAQTAGPGTLRIKIEFQFDSLNSNYTAIAHRLGFPAIAGMDLSTDYDSYLEGEGGTKTTVHEMLHHSGLVAGAWNPWVTADRMHISGPNLLLAAKELGYGPGALKLSTITGHFDEDSVGQEMMSGSGGVSDLSVLSLGALLDLGLPVNMYAADITNAAKMCPGIYGPLDPTEPDYPGPSTSCFAYQWGGVSSGLKMAPMFLDRLR